MEELKIIGQDNLLKLINTFTLTTIPRTLLFIGEEGCGKHLFAKYLANKLQLETINLNELNREYIILKERCNQQIEKIRELKTQLREAKNEAEQSKTELNDFKNQIKSITNNKVEESEIIKQISRTIDRTSKKISKANNKKKK